MMQATTQKTLAEIRDLQVEIKELKNELERKKRRLRHLTYKTAYEKIHGWGVEDGPLNFRVDVMEKWLKGQRKTYETIRIFYTSNLVDSSKVYISK